MVIKTKVRVTGQYQVLTPLIFLSLALQLSILTISDIIFLHCKSHFQSFISFQFETLSIFHLWSRGILASMNLCNNYFFKLGIEVFSPNYFGHFFSLENPFSVIHICLISNNANFPSLNSGGILTSLEWCNNYAWITVLQPFSHL